MPIVPTSDFADDRGSADPLLADALARYASGGPDLDVLAALSGGRVLVATVAELGGAEVGEHGLVHEKSADIAVVLFQRPDGRRALLAFTSADTFGGWNAEARPRPLRVADAARAALDEGADALLLDLAGPVRFAVETAEVRRLAAGHRLQRTDAGYVWVEPS